MAVKQYDGNIYVCCFCGIEDREVYIKDEKKICRHCGSEILKKKVNNNGFILLAWILFFIIIVILI